MSFFSKDVENFFKNIPYYLYCILGIIVMFIVWTPIFKFIGWLLTPFTTPILDIKHIGSLSIFAIFGYCLLLLIIFGTLLTVIIGIGEVFKRIFKKEKLIYKSKELFNGIILLAISVLIFKYFNNGEWKYIGIGFFTLGGIGCLGMAFEKVKK